MSLTNEEGLYPNAIKSLSELYQVSIRTLSDLYPISIRALSNLYQSSIRTLSFKEGTPKDLRKVSERTRSDLFSAFFRPISKILPQKFGGFKILTYPCRCTLSGVQTLLVKNEKRYASSCLLKPRKFQLHTRWHRDLLTCIAWDRCHYIFLQRFS